MSPRETRFAALICVFVSACGGEPPSYQNLVVERLRTELPGAAVAPEGADVSVRLGERTTRIDVAEIQRLCSRGPRDCEFALGDAVLRARGDVR
jgi:hypothetical protein